MPHMAPIMWTLILMMSVSLVVVMASMVFFSYTMSSPSIKSKDLEVMKVNWKW
uniref:Atp8 protein n=1 Tax=Lepas anserifera TaxID=245079 RepID=A0A0C5CG91_9CRUS|nr:ATP synthase F0 subunit 8 [Lepas anserifera]AJN90584.1 ATP synthase F0 subunit 8 [Lepas anserifera]